MLDLSYFQNDRNVNTQTFTNAGSWVTWVKPRGAKFVNIMCIGSGGGGGGGFITGSGNKYGGGSGGSGGIVRAQFQTSILPDILYVYTGLGGAGGLGGNPSTNGVNGEKSYVCLIPDTGSSSNIVVTSGNLSARLGSGGTSTTGAGGNGETIATIANAIFLNLGAFLAVAGQAGVASTTTSGTNVTVSNIVSAGAAGAGGVLGPGGAINGAGPIPTIPGGTTTSIQGKDGLILYKPILAFTGGSGGINGGKGGNGAYGCGGGGGGSNTAGSGNDGGRGGDGLIIITTSF